MIRIKKVTYIVVLICLAALIFVGVFMTWPRYQRTTEQLPDLIEGSGGNNEALLQIRSTLDDAASQAAENTDPSQGMNADIVWTGSVYAARYQTLSGDSSVFYVCPYIVLVTAPATASDEPFLDAAPAGNETDESGQDKSSDIAEGWTISLHFAVSAMVNGELTDVGNRISVRQIQFSCRVDDPELILKAGYGDGELNSVNNTTVSYQFLDREKVSNDTDALAKLEVSMPEGTEASAVFNWSFVIYEKNHVIGNLDNVQITLPLTDSEESGTAEESTEGTSEEETSEEAASAAGQTALENASLENADIQVRRPDAAGGALSASQAAAPAAAARKEQTYGIL
ncbi:MAG: hypothetical protein ACOX8B_09910 [Lachnospiraceae bacterium]|jgi:hypothetical protein